MRRRVGATREGATENRRSTPGARPVSFGLSHDEADATANRNVRCPTCPKSPDAALRPGRARLASARRSEAEIAVACMAALARVPRAAAGMATIRAGTGLRRPSRSADGCDRSFRRLRKQGPADEQKTEGKMCDRRRDVRALTKSAGVSHETAARETGHMRQ